MFITKLQEVRKEALAYIESVIATRGTNYELCPPQEDDGTWEEVYEMPTHVHHTKHNLTEEYYIYLINVDKEGRLLFDGYSTDSNTDKAFFDEELLTGTICQLADLIHSLETQTS